jgi:ribonuclease HII
MGYILGIDEVGRGAWAGPLVVGAVILGDYQIDGLTDSKLLSKISRQEFARLIQASAVSAALGWVESSEIDEIGLTKATELGIWRALEGIDCAYSDIIIDGSINYLKDYKNSKCIIKADHTVPAVSAASIIAKVARDEYMHKLAVKYPGYGFESHVGYGTKKHSQAIDTHGVTDFHRLSFKPVADYGPA